MPPDAEKSRPAREPDPMGRWVQLLRTELDIPDEVDVRLVLDVARASAHRVARPAAPVTAYLLGVAVGRGVGPTGAGDGSGEAELRRLADRVRALLPPEPETEQREG